MSTAQQILETDASIIAGGAEDKDQYLTFIMADEEYGVDILRVHEIKGWDNVTPIPNTPSYVRGVINLRGTIVPIIDLRRRFGMKSIAYGETTVVIMLRVIEEDGERTMGIVVDAVSEVHNVSPDKMKPAPDFGSVIQADFIKGLTTVDDTMIVLLDIDNLLNSTDMLAVNQAHYEQDIEDTGDQVEQEMLAGEQVEQEIVSGEQEEPKKAAENET